MAFAGPPPQMLPPHILILRRPGIYEDEYYRLWLVTNLDICTHSPYCNRLRTCISVHLCQVVSFPHEITSTTPSNLNYLPRMWRLYSMGTYRGSDAMVWRVSEHFQVGNTVRLILRMD
ncbi:protein TCL1B2-like [Grammomys surdaster]|uniref:protein TCL1B2-like n=1 Tax=Grammomys surdaster TaxID=491861 RepID=UPI0010A02648|nr:protein TCL1B2-like [Grammomys surdaster]